MRQFHFYSMILKNILLAWLLLLPSYDCWAQESLIPVVGFSGAGRTNSSARFDFDLALLLGESRDGAAGAGLVLGLSSQSRDEFYAGPALGIFYMGSLWLETVGHWKKGQLAAVRATAALGYFLMPFVSLGYDREKRKGMGELGLMLKFPFR